MKTYDNKTPTLFLKPGELHIARDPLIISTVLGSCVSVTMFSRRLRMGGICHAVLPSSESAERRCCPVNCMKCNDKNTSFRYVDCSIIYMLGQFTMYGISKSEIEVKMFGGADMIVSTYESGFTSVAKKNIECAIRTLRQNNINLLSCDTGGIAGRKIHFNTHSGEVLLKHLKYKADEHVMIENRTMKLTLKKRT